VAVSTPAPFPGTTAAPYGSSRPGPNLYTDSIVKLNKDTGKVEWHYQLTPHDINDWDLENSPILTRPTARPSSSPPAKAASSWPSTRPPANCSGRPPSGTHNGHDHDGLLTLAQAKAKLKPPYKVFPASSAASNPNWPPTAPTSTPPPTTSPRTYTDHTNKGINSANFAKGTGDIVALNQATGKIVWDHKLNQSPYGAASITNDVLFTTTFDGKVWALSTPKPAKRSGPPNSPPAPTPRRHRRHTVITAGSFQQGKTQKPRSSPTDCRAKNSSNWRPPSR